MESQSPQDNTFHILHFNDVYNLSERKKEPCGGAARFITATQQYRHLDPLVLFSGDIFSPSKLSNIMKGKQMLEFFNHFKIDVSCLGNHDLDFGVDRFVSLKERCGHPWIMTNVFDPHSEDHAQIAGCVDHVIFERNGVKIGVIGLAEEEWLDSVISLEEDDYEYHDFVKVARKWCKKLREDGCDIIVALTHMRMPNDKKLTTKVDDLDLVLGGHDHSSAALNINNTLLCKSGTDFREFSVIEVVTDCSEDDLNNEPHESIINHDKKLIIRCKKVTVNSDFEPNPEMKQIIDDYWSSHAKKMDYIAGCLGEDMDARFDQVRVRETNVCNFVADVVRYFAKADVCLLNSGSFRTDEIIPKGFLKWKDIDTLFPIIDPVIVILTSGENLLKALENGVSATPKLEGRFPAISGVRIKYDSSKPEGERIFECTVNGAPLNHKKLYSVATKRFLYKGKDGFDALTDSELIIDEEHGVVINTSLISFFKLMIKENSGWYNKCHKQVDECLKIANNFEDKEFVTKDDDGKDLKYHFYKFFPKIDGRLTDINDK